ncbi:TetR/AcrR family transcriptional regulator [Gimibacter soli]|uniref:TetR/AcrR family transcriptional regulator n=1 Tax=Gimibacter soli TaxID=3024400 RepID=A0AAE9XU93_9PROT|nr:TetR/AcrR family transcriptional regulator [Gimibacter soli]WCL53628.1 TetR/AcrR family transcriptional regulator [Gimibacter soli]
MAAVSTAKKQPVRRRQADRREESRERILDAAEELLARRGYDGVTMREIASASATDTSLLHYYFNTKAGLFDAVIARRAGIVNETRQVSLDAYAAGHAGKMTAEGVVRAYLEPTFRFMMSGEPGFLNYGALIAKLNSTAMGGDVDTTHTPFDPVVRRLVEMLAEVRPDVKEADIYWFYHLMSGAISLSLAQTGRIDVLSGGQCRSGDFAAILDRMTRVFGEGFKSLGKLA